MIGPKRAHGTRGMIWLLVASLWLWSGCDDDAGQNSGGTSSGTDDTASTSGTSGTSGTEDGTSGTEGDGTSGGTEGDGTSGGTSGSTSGTTSGTTSGDTSGTSGTEGDAGDTTDTADPAVLLTIEVIPADQTITAVAGTPSQTITYTAQGHYDDDTTRDLSADVVWVSTNPFIGSIDTQSGVYTTSNNAGGQTQIIAQLGDVSGETNLFVTLRGGVIADDATTLPSGVDALFEDPAATVITTAGATQPSMVYPSHETMFPRNIHLILFQWNKGTDNDLFQLKFESATTELSVYTDSDRWEASLEVWQWLAHSNAGQPVQVTLSAIDQATPGEIRQANPLTIYFSRSDVPGAIYYWSTSTEAVMKGLPDSPTPERFYTQPGDNTCVACHTVSRNGQRLAIGYGGEKLQVVSIPERDVIIPAERTVGWSTFSPDASLIVYSAAGTLRLIDGATGDSVGPNDGLLPLEGYKANHPNWSPDGQYIAFSGTIAGKADNKGMEKGNIMRIPYNDGAWGPVEVIVPAAGDVDNNFFPSYSPDSQWIAYVNAQGKSKDAPSAILRLVAADGTTPPRTLRRINERVNQADGVLTIGNSMPTWAPSTAPGVQWLAFSSLRDYGKVLVGTRRDQLWIAAILPDLPDGEDPSFPAFWAPFQAPEASNHRAFWAHDASQSCPSSVELCDGLDNDCDGIVDNNCTPCAASETCGDSVDNDCDGETDEGCICTPAEVCVDGFDNDCNGQIDDGCENTCQPVEICEDAIDNNCNGEVNEGCSAECSDIELCNGFDDNCDGTIDEGCNCQSEELCVDGIDNDCNGFIDDGCNPN